MEGPATEVAWPDSCSYFRVDASQSRPSHRPSPRSAHVPCMCHILFLRSCNPSPSLTSSVLIAPLCVKKKRHQSGRLTPSLLIRTFHRSAGIHSSSKLTIFQLAIKNFKEMFSRHSKELHNNTSSFYNRSYTAWSTHSPFYGSKYSDYLNNMYRLTSKKKCTSLYFAR